MDYEDVLEYQPEGKAYTLKYVMDDKGIVIVGGNNLGRDLEIPSVIDGQVVYSIGDSAFYGSGLRGNLVLPDTLTSIGYSAFQSCALTGNLNLPGNLTSIGESAFYGCSGLTGSLVLPDTLTSIGSSAFEGCSGFNGVLKLPDTLNSIGWRAFYGCSNLTGEVPLPKNLSVDNIGVNAFAGCDKLKLLWEEDTNPTAKPSTEPTAKPSTEPTAEPSTEPTVKPSIEPTAEPSTEPAVKPSTEPTVEPSTEPTVKPSTEPTVEPSAEPTAKPGTEPTTAPTAAPPAEDDTKPQPEGDLIYFEGNYYFYENGEMAASKEAFVNGAWRWFDEDGTMAADKDVYLASNGGKWVRYNEKGEMVKGEDCRDGGWYYFDLVTGAMAKGPVVLEDNRQVYYDTVTGLMLKGRQMINGQGYYFDDVDGHLVNGENTKIWVQIDGREFWYENWERQGWDVSDPSYRGKEIYDPASNAWYWLDNVQQGAKAVSKDVYQESYSAYPDREDGTGKWVRYDERGRMIKGWDTTEAGTYYFEEITGAMAKGHVVIGGKIYDFDTITGILQE